MDFVRHFSGSFERYFSGSFMRHFSGSERYFIGSFVRHVNGSFVRHFNGSVKVKLTATPDFFLSPRVHLCLPVRVNEDVIKLFQKIIYCI